jgi:hypothetical protein
MPLYAASDLHANNNFIAILDEQGKRVFKSKLPNDPIPSPPFPLPFPPFPFLGKLRIEAFRRLPRRHLFEAAARIRTGKGTYFLS